MKWPTGIRRRRDGVAVLFALGLTALLATGALAIDLGMLFTARAEAQRVADATALAAASSFKDFFADSATAVDTANARGLLYATENTIRGVQVVPTDVAMEIDFNAFTATAWVRSPRLGTWMARTFGITNAVVQAKAKAWFGPLGGVKCVKPFAVPDMWSETDIIAEDMPHTNPGPPVVVTPPNRIWDTDEAWRYEPLLGDHYAQWDPFNPNDLSATGYHSQWRNQITTAPPFDLGLVITIKAQNPLNSIASGFFYPWRIGSSSGANDYKANITGCNPEGASTGVPYDIENGNMVGPTSQAILDVMDTDPNAWWNPATKKLEQSLFLPNWRNSPRVMIVGLFDPNQIAAIQGGGNLQITFNNFALFFLEGLDTSAVPSAQAPVMARFIGFAAGSDDGVGPAGPLNRRLRLIE